MSTQDKFLKTFFLPISSPIYPKYSQWTGAHCLLFTAHQNQLSSLRFEALFSLHFLFLLFFVRTVTFERKSKQGIYETSRCSSFLFLSLLLVVTPIIWIILWREIYFFFEKYFSSYQLNYTLLNCGSALFFVLYPPFVNPILIASFVHIPQLLTSVSASEKQNKICRPFYFSLLFLQLYQVSPHF